MKTMQHRHLMQVIRDKLVKGKNITIFGWLDSNHSPNTRKYERTGRIIFLEKKGKVAKVSGDFVLFTEFISHPDQKKMQKTTSSLYPHTVSIGLIKSILAKLESLIVAKPKASGEGMTLEEIAILEKEQELSLNELEQILIDTEIIMDKYERLATRFKDVSNSHPEGLVSINEVAKILKDLGFEKNARVLAKDGWLISHTSEGGKKIGWYKSGPKLQELIKKGKIEEPKDPMEKLDFLIKQEPYFDAKIAEIQEQLALWEAQRARVKTAKEIKRKIEENAEEIKRRIIDL